MCASTSAYAGACASRYWALTAEDAAKATAPQAGAGASRGSRARVAFRNPAQQFDSNLGRDARGENGKTKVTLSGSHARVDGASGRAGACYVAGG